VKIIPPITVTESIYTGGDIPETDAAAWNSGTSYTIGQQVIYSHSLYEALTNNTNKTPNAYPADWARVSATNAWKLFDYTSNSATSQATSFTVELTMPGTYNALAMFGLVGSRVVISVDYDGDEIYNSETTITTRPDSAGSWYGFFFGRFVQISDINKDVPLPLGAVLTVTVYADTGGNAECAALVVGKLINIGDTQLGSSVDSLDFSQIEEDAWGNLNITPGKKYKTGSLEVVALIENSDYVKRTLESYTGVPVVYIGSDDFQATKILGISRAAPMVYRDCALVTFSLELRSVI
jgi:hypothetical protein